MRPKLLLCLMTALPCVAGAQDLTRSIHDQAAALLPKVIEWRRYLHQHPELSDQEVNTATFVVDHLQQLGMDIHTEVGGHGVLAILHGKKPGPVIALRADMDALPVTEKTDVPFASHDTALYNGQTVGVMHACGHDAHTAMLLGAATILAGMRDKLAGTVVFFFQPCEEGAPPGMPGGAARMISQGAMDNPKVDVVFGLHIQSNLPIGDIVYKPGSFMASADEFNIHITGKSAHGSQPWLSIDPVVVAAQIIEGLQTIVSRQEDISKAPVVISVGTIQSGVRWNIIPGTADLTGTMRTLDPAMQKDVHDRFNRTVTAIASASGAKADVSIDTKTLVTYNDSALTAQMLPSLQKAAGAEHVHLAPSGFMMAEDFSFYGQKAPAMFFFLGGLPVGADPAKAPPHHTDHFYIDDSRLDVGVATFCQLVFDYAKMHPAR
ncbi:MAG TPA: amidohydrolase [Dinghuibacter sp.]|jgi:amidohydrolase|uniref:amidohydrolase n=1 Tax=Dinghuibacter sp. TaxID=2024697 RepID=UPI002CF1EF06|nr:amidohydrolase [Dinghuibacter sp.]HTJ12679.1 amidohydrolase [Dinghuibacter sp.]